MVRISQLNDGLFFRCIRVFRKIAYHPMEPGILHSVDILHTWHIILHTWHIILHIWHIILHNMAYHLAYLAYHLTYLVYHLT